MADFDPAAPVNYNGMQQQAGLLPPVFQPPPIPFPGQVSAALAQGGPAAVSFLTAPASGPGFAGNTSAQFSPMAAQMAMGGGTGGFMTQGSVGTSFGAGMFPGQMLQGFTNQTPMFQGPTGVMMPMNPAASFNAYPGMNPYAGLAAHGPYQGAPGMFTPMAPLPPPVYAGQMAQMHPLMPPPATPMFNTSYGAGIERQQLRADTAYAQNLTRGGVLSRLGADLSAGAAGAMLGGRFGGGIGAAVGGIAGFMGAELSGIGRGAQNLFMNQIASPMLHQRAMAGGIEELSRGFISSGPDLNARGAGFTHHAAAEVARGLRDMASSDSFQRQTGNRFNQQDLFKITQESARNDLFTGVQNPEQMTGRVREIAKSLTSFMQLAQEPDIQRAIQTMGQMRSSGLTMPETMNAVSNGRTFARMAGQSFSDIMSQSGAMGSQTYQSMGLTQGAGVQAGMMNYAIARGSQNAGTMNPLLMNLVGGAQGLANMNNVFGASTLQMPMMAPSILSASGGVNQGALNQLLGGQMSPFAQTSQATAAIQSMTRSQGVGGLGMAIGMQPYMQSFLAQQLQSQGPFAQRNLEDRNLFGLMRNMNLRGAGGLMTAAQIMGMSGPEAQSRMQELNSPAYFERQRQQIEATRREARQTELDQREAMRPGFFDTAGRDLGLDPGVRMHRMGAAISHFFHPFRRSEFRPTTDEGIREDRRRLGTASYAEFARTLGDEGDRASTAGRSRLERFSDQYQVSQARGYGGIGALINVGIGEFGSEHQQQAEMADIREGSRYAGLLSSASNAEMTRGTEALTRQFGAAGATSVTQGTANRIAAALGREQSGMSHTGTNLFNLIAGTALSTAAGAATGSLIGGPLGTAVGGVVGLGVGLSGAGDVFRQRSLTGTDVRKAAIDAMMAQGGMNREQATAYFQQHGSEIVTASTARLQAQMTPEQRTALYSDAENGGVGAGRGGANAAAETRGRQARENLFGRGAGVETQDAFLRVREQFRTVSRDPRKASAERNYMTSMAMLNQRLRDDPSGEERTRIERQIDELDATARSQGVDVNNTTIQNQITRGADTLGSSAANRAMARDFAGHAAGQTGSQILNNVANQTDELGNVRAYNRERGGFAALARGNNPLAEALRSAGAGDSSKFNESRVFSALQGMSAEHLQSLSPEMRRAVQGLSSSDPRAVARAQAQLRNVGYNAGTRDESLRSEYQRTHTDLSRAYNAIFHGGEEGYVNRNMNRSTAADDRADAQTEQTGLLETMAGELGLGGDRDMASAASELRAAAEALQSVVQGGALDRAVNPE